MELMRARTGGVLCRPQLSGSVLNTQNRDVNDPGSGARRRPRALSGSFTSRLGPSKWSDRKKGGCHAGSRAMLCGILGDLRTGTHVTRRVLDCSKGARIRAHYASEPLANRSTSPTVRMGAPDRRGNAGTPRAMRMSASTKRRSNASANWSTSWPAC